MTAITIRNLTKRFGDTVAVDGVSLTINSGELFFLLGPSGCGKTTLLRMIAGFIEPTAGSVRFGQTDVTLLPPNRRNTGMVFQSYALWPHMTVFDNVAYGLNVRKVPAAERRERAMAALRSVRMDELAGRKPNQLSGGQQQRVALARALVIQPTVLLLDEPLSNLDARLRLEMRSEIRRLCTETRITTVYVTHDQKEALSMADSVAVLRQGKVVQHGAPRALYQRPNSRFVAEFLGETNLLPAVVSGADNGQVRLETAAGAITSLASDTTPRGGNVTCSIRPEALRLSGRSVDGNDARAADNVIAGRVASTIYLGEMAQHIIELADGVSVRVLELNPGAMIEPGAAVRLAVDAADVVILTD